MNIFNQNLFNFTQLLQKFAIYFLSQKINFAMFATFSELNQDWKSILDHLYNVFQLDSRYKFRSLCWICRILCFWRKNRFQTFSPLEWAILIKMRFTNIYSLGQAFFNPKIFESKGFTLYIFFIFCNFSGIVHMLWEILGTPDIHEIYLKIYFGNMRKSATLWI